VAAAISAIVRLDVLGGEDRPRRRTRHPAPEQRVLQGEVLGDGLDHDVDRFQVRHGRRELQARERGIAIRGLQLPLLDEFGERLLDSRAPAVQELLRDVAPRWCRSPRSLRPARCRCPSVRTQNAHAFDVPTRSSASPTPSPRGRGRGFSNALRTSSAILTSGCTPGSDGVSRNLRALQAIEDCSSEMWIRSLSAR